VIEILKRSPRIIGTQWRNKEFAYEYRATRASVQLVSEEAAQDAFHDEQKRFAIPTEADEHTDAL
jgi:hypothetical protein